MDEIMGWLILLVPAIMAIIIWITANSREPSKVLLVVAAVLVLLAMIVIWWIALSNGWNPLELWNSTKRLVRPAA